MDELEEKIKKALDESETYGDFISKLYEIPEFIDEVKGMDGFLCFLEETMRKHGNQNIKKG